MFFIVRNSLSTLLSQNYTKRQMSFRIDAGQVEYDNPLKGHFLLTWNKRKGFSPSLTKEVSFFRGPWVRSERFRSVYNFSHMFYPSLHLNDWTPRLTLRTWTVEWIHWNSLGRLKRIKGEHISLHVHVYFYIYFVSRILGHGLSTGVVLLTVSHDRGRSTSRVVLRESP